MNISIGGNGALLPLYLMHVIAEPHPESLPLIWSIFSCNVFVVVAGIIFIYKLFKQRNVALSGITFGIALVINYILIAIYGSIFDLLG